MSDVRALRGAKKEILRLLEVTKQISLHIAEDNSIVYYRDLTGTDL